MTIDLGCYVCGKEELCINGLCHECTMNELFNPGAAFAATFGAMCEPVKPIEPEAALDEDDSDAEKDA